MTLRKWNDLPSEMKTPSVKVYYEILQKKKKTLFIKRAFDIIVSLIMLVLLSPAFLILAVAIKIDSTGPVFYRQERVTQYALHFRIHKFRTMVQNADKGSLVTIQNDSRITRVGKLIRKCRLDELPQLIDIFTGKMTFVGARPEVPKYVKAYTEEMMATLLLPAGVTSLASIAYKDEDEIIAAYKAKGELSIDDIYVKHILPAKMQYNLEYIEDLKFLGDIKLMFKTVLSVLKRRAK